MLELPDVGMQKSVNSHNIKFDVLCDWIEGSILFDENKNAFSVMDVADVLVDSGIYDDQDFAMQIVGDAWWELERRLDRITSMKPFSITYPRVEPRIDSWEDVPAYSFCILLSLGRCYQNWEECVAGGNYGAQGEIFELLTQESLEKQFSDWQVERTGWSRTQPASLRDVVNQVAAWLGKTARDHVNPNSKEKDAGLDLLCYRPFPDNRDGFPVYLMQCASGKHWSEKINEPNINRWKWLIEFVNSPQRAFAIPFALSDDDFRECCVLIQGLFLDRCRLLAAARYCEQWESSALKDRILKWAQPRVQRLMFV